MPRVGCTRADDTTRGDGLTSGRRCHQHVQLWSTEAEAARTAASLRDTRRESARDGRDTYECAPRRQLVLAACRARARAAAPAARGRIAWSF
eukprot:COSAG02_NODE_3753_length_6282_cov_25.845221_2_plen_92_part_00